MEINNIGKIFKMENFLMRFFDFDIENININVEIRVSLILNSDYNCT